MTSIDVKVAEELRELYEEVHRSTEMNLGLLHRAYHRGYLAGIRDAEPILEQRKRNAEARERNAEEAQKQDPDQQDLTKEKSLQLEILGRALEISGRRQGDLTLVQLGRKSRLRAQSGGDGEPDSERPKSG